MPPSTAGDIAWQRPESYFQARLPVLVLIAKSTPLLFAKKSRP